MDNEFISVDSSIRKNYMKKGNCILYNKSKNDYLIVIGPEWYISIIGIILTIIIGNIILYFFWDLMGDFSKIIYFLFFFLIVYLYLSLSLSNPGIFFAKDNNILEEVSCLKCKTPKSIRAVHCDECNVCIEQYDHHCVWIGKCVGKNNLETFYLFAISIPLFFIFVIILAGFLGLDKN